MKCLFAVLRKSNPQGQTPFSIIVYPSQTLKLSDQLSIDYSLGTLRIIDDYLISCFTTYLVGNNISGGS